MLADIAAELKFGKEARKERALSLHVPYTRHVNENVIATKSNDFLTIIKIDGFFFQTADQAEINMRHSVFNTIVRALSSSRYCVYTHIVRRRVAPEIPGEFTDPFCRELNRRYMDNLSKRRMYTNDLYLTLVRRPLQGALGLTDKLSALLSPKANKGVHKESDNDAIKDLLEKSKDIVSELKPYGARLLGIAERDGAPFSEPAEFFAQLINGAIPHPMRLPRMGLDQYVGRSRHFFGRQAVEIRGATRDTTRYAAMLGIKEYPPLSAPGLLDGLLMAGHEFILSQSFAIVDKPVALERMNRLQRQISGSDEGGTEVETDLDEARNNLVQQEAVYGNHHLSLLCIAPELDQLDRVVGDLGSHLTEMNINWLREDLNLEPSYWAQLPGNTAYVARKSMISSLNFCGFTSFHNFARGQREDLHWGSPIALLETTSQTPYVFNFHQADTGHFNITGMNGTGKTLLMLFLLAQSMRVRPEPKAVFFDKDRGGEILIRAMGGVYEILEPGTSTGFAPLQIDNTPYNREFLYRLLSGMLRPRAGADLDHVEEGILRDAIRHAMEIPREERQLGHLHELLAGRTRPGQADLASRLAPWLDPDQKGWLFNAKRDRLTFTNARVFGFDMTKILDEPEVRTPAVDYIFHRTDELLTGDPVLIFMDEGWKLLDDPKFASFIKDKLKTIRKLNGIVGFGTQSAADVVRSVVANTLLEQTATDIHFVNPKADEESYCKHFRLSEKEFDFVQNTPKEARTFLIKHGLDSVVARLNLAGMDDLIKVLSGRKSTVEELDRLRARVGDDPAKWLPIFCGWESEHEAA